MKEKHQLIRFFSLLRSYHNDQGGFLYEKQTNFFTSFIICICPFGIYIGVLYRRWNLSEKVLSFFSVSLIYEVLQYVLAIGRSDITDVIMNTVGGIVGLLIYSLLNKICRNERMTEIVVFICAAFGSAAVSGFLLAIFHAN